VKPPKSRRSRRVVPLPVALVAILAEHRARQDERRRVLGGTWQDHDLVIDGLRRAGLSLQALRRITKTLQSDFGDEWALASHRLTLSGGAGPSGPEVLWDYAEEHGDDEVLIALDSKQRVFTDVVRDYLERIVYLDEYAGQIYLPLTREKLLLIDPYRNFGRPMFGSTATPVGPVMDRIESGEPIGSVAKDYGLDVDEIELVVRHAPAIAA
jgi:uncharacterized protein (DUF433 family)